MINKSGVAKSFPGSFLQRGLNGELCIRTRGVGIAGGVTVEGSGSSRVWWSEAKNRGSRVVGRGGKEGHEQTRGAGIAGGVMVEGNGSSGVWWSGAENRGSGVAGRGGKEGHEQ
nr:hypothetical protein [Tanacetum cinerariifolium]